MSRLQLLIVLAVVLLIVAYGNWLVKTFQTTTGIGPREVRHEPDFFIEDVISTMMDAEGKPLYRLQADVINHYPDDKSLALRAPHLEYYRQQLPPWTAQSEAGRIYDDGRQVFLDGKVTMHRPAEGKQPKTELQTRDLLILTEDNYAETDANVKITSGASELKGTGMRVYLDEGRLELLANGEGIYAIRP
jgi:lipopolysaccharide export system protein LptC